VLLRFDGHRFAVKAFAWCKQYKCMASSGLDRDILLWDVTTGHSIGRLRGHQAPVAHLVYYERQDNLFSLDQRHYMLVWDVSKQVLLSRIDTDEGDPYFNYHAFRAGSLLINQRRGHIVLCARRPFVWTVRALENADDIGLSSHSTALLATLYSPVLEQIVSLDLSGLVLVWEFSDGRVSFRFKLASAADDGRDVDSTCAALDASQREVLVGFANGCVQAYNFNNGALLNRYLCGTGPGSPVLAVRASEQREKRGGMIFASTLDGYVWMWVLAPMQRPGVVPYEKRFRLPSDRPNFDSNMDVLALAHHRSGLLATGRQDGRVLVWNTVDGRLKRDLVDDFFTLIDLDGPGTLTYAEVVVYLRDHLYSQEAIDDFLRRADQDGSRVIGREEFRAALARQGSLAIDPLTGNRLVTVKRNQQVEMVRFIETGELLILVSVTAEGVVSVFNAETGRFLRALSPPCGKRSDALTCFAVDEVEGLMFTGDCVGMLKAYDINQLCCGAGGARPVQINLLQVWKAHYEAVNTLAVVQASLAIVSCNGGPEPRILVWTYGGQLVGVAGDRFSRMWGVPAEPDRGLLMRMRVAAMQASPQKAEAAAEPRLGIREREAEEGAREARGSAISLTAAQLRRRRRIERRVSTLQSAAYTVIKKNILDKAVVRRAELDVRQKRVRLFFKLHQHRFADSPGLAQRFEEHMEAVWRSEIEENERQVAAQRAAAAGPAATAATVASGVGAVGSERAPAAQMPLKHAPSDRALARRLPSPPVGRETAQGPGQQAGVTPPSLPPLATYNEPSGPRPPAAAGIIIGEWFGFREVTTDSPNAVNRVVTVNVWFVLITESHERLRSEPPGPQNKLKPPPRIVHRRQGRARA
jgi:hypothetical protein